MKLNQEIRMAYSHPPAPTAVAPAPRSQAELDHYQADLAAYEAARTHDKQAHLLWRQARDLLKAGQSVSDKAMTRDNDCHDLNPEVGVLAARENLPEGAVNTTLAFSRPVRLPGHWWKKQTFATTVTDFASTTRLADGRLCFERTYKSQLDQSKFPKIIWEFASDARSQHPGLQPATQERQVEVNYRDDVMVLRLGTPAESASDGPSTH